MKAIVSLNSGSSSIKFALFKVCEAGKPSLVAGGKIEGIGIAPHLIARDVDGNVVVERQWKNGGGLTHADLLKDLFAWARDRLKNYEVLAIGHRVVHGGIDFIAPQLVDDQLLAALDQLCPLAPLHQPHNLVAIRAVAALRPGLPQVACFDTAFHHSMPDSATRFAIPRALYDQGVRRYGFHGLSYEYIARQLQEIDPELGRGRVIVAHLGNGASLCAMKDGKSVNTTMGFTTLDGLVMGTRCGSIDGGLVLHLQSQMGMSLTEIETMLYKQSGLLGVSGISSDMRALAASEAPEAQEAIDLFAWRVVQKVGAFAADLGGLDGLVFTAGIGENDANIRRLICERLEWLGLQIDDDANRENAPVISKPDSPVKVRVIPTDEEQMLALHTLSVLNGRPQ